MRAFWGAPSVVLIVFIVINVHFHLDLVFILSKRGIAILVKVCRKKINLGRNYVHGFLIIRLLACLHFLPPMLGIDLIGVKIWIYLSLERRDIRRRSRAMKWSIT